MVDHTDATAETEIEVRDQPRFSHDPEMVARNLASKLASRARHVCMLIGAGASCSVGLPTLKQVEDVVRESFHDSDRELIDVLFSGRDLESSLSWLRRLQNLLDDEVSLYGISRAKALELDAAICNAIITAVDSSHSDISAFENLASWAARMDNHSAVELFTVNYDLLIERGLEAVAVPHFDGFVGSVEAPFVAELVEPRDAPIERLLPSGFVRVWKLHGSTNWRVRGDGNARTIVRVGADESVGIAAIYPSDEKYEDSRRVPFVVLMDRLRRALVEPETISITTGFSFGDAHINEMLFDAALRHPRSEVVALCYDEIPEILASRAQTTRNLVVLSPTEAIVDGKRAPWSSGVDLPGVFESGRFLLGDFTFLSAFLAKQIVQADV